MAERGVGAVVVLEGEAIAAILTERDVLKAVAAGEDGSASVSEWMTRHPDTIEPDETTDQAAALMIHGGFRHLPVVEGGDARRDRLDPRPDAGYPRGRRASRRLTLAPLPRFCAATLVASAQKWLVTDCHKRRLRAHICCALGWQRPVGRITIETHAGCLPSTRSSPP